MTKKTPEPADIHVGKRIRARRKILAMSQTVLGKKIGVTFQQVQKYERATNRIGSSRLLRIASALNIPVAWFFEGLPQPIKGQDPLDGLRIAAKQNITLIKDERGLRAVGEICRAVAEVGHLNENFDIPVAAE